MPFLPTFNVIQIFHQRGKGPQVKVTSYTLEAVHSAYHNIVAQCRVLLPGIGRERSWKGSRVTETFLQAKHLTLLSRTPSNTSFTMLVVRGGPTAKKKDKVFSLCLSLFNSPSLSAHTHIDITCRELHD